MAYQEKYVAFLDILGFKEIVKSSSNKNGNHGKSKIHQALRYMDIIAEMNDQAANNINKENVIRHISDSIILSYPVHNFELLLESVATLQFNLAEYGMYLRGAITFGEVFDEDGPIYGPGIIEAYELESSHAIYPRVILSESVLKKEKETLKIISQTIKTDRDGMVYINWKYRKSQNNHEHFNNIILGINSNITKMLKKYKKKPNIHQKYQWLNDYLADA